VAAPIGNGNALRHSGYSESRNRAQARAEKRRFLARNGMLASQLSGPQMAYLEVWARCASKARTVDAYLGEHGLIRADGTPQPVLAFYTSLQNSARLAMTRLEASLRDTRPDPTLSLRNYFDALDGDEDTPL
jgi:hypothetical protein